MNALALMYVAFGGAVGSMARYSLVTLINKFNHGDFPYGTFVVNVAGGFLMGVWIATMATMLPAKAKDLHLLFAVGALGGFTTFSAFTIDVFLLMERGMMGQAFLYAFGSVVVSLAALIIGMWLVRLASA